MARRTSSTEPRRRQVAQVQPPAGQRARARGRARPTISSASRGPPGQPERVRVQRPRASGRPRRARGPRSARRSRHRRRTPSRSVSALRSTRAVGTQRPSSLKTRTPASTISPSSAIDSPREALRDRADREDVAEAGGRRPRSRTSCDHGRVVGHRVGVRHRRDRRVPADRGRRACPVSTVSLCSRPGSRRCVCRSTSPGASDEPVAVDRARRPSAASPSPTPRSRRPSTSTSATLVAAGGRVDHARARRSSDRPLSHRAPPPRLRAAEQQVQERHPDRDAVRHLLLDHGLRAGRRRRSRSRRRGSSGPGCMISAPSGSIADALARQAEQPRVLAHAREVLLAAGAPAGRGACSRRRAWAATPSMS